MEPTPITTERLNLRRFKERDAAFLFEALDGDEDAERYLTMRRYRTEDEMRSAVAGWIRDSADNAHPSCRWCIEEATTRDPIGYIGAHRDANPTVAAYSVSYWIADKHRGHGYAVEALRAIIKHLICSEGAIRVEAEVDATNGASSKVAERAGMVLEGILRANRCDGYGNVADTAVFSVVPGDLERANAETER